MKLRRLGTLMLHFDFKLQRETAISISALDIMAAIMTTS